jgi:hypothetical protein
MELYLIYVAIRRRGCLLWRMRDSRFFEWFGRLFREDADAPIALLAIAAVAEPVLAVDVAVGRLAADIGEDADAPVALLAIAAVAQFSP